MGTAYSLAAASGAFALTGSAATLGVGRGLAAASGAYVLTGEAATLTYTPYPSIVMLIAPSVTSYITVLVSAHPVGSSIMGPFAPGQTVVLMATFTNSSTGTLIAPATITLEVLDPSPNETTYTGGFTNLSTGVYSLNVIANLSGTWMYRWSATYGSYTAAAQGSFQVLPTMLN